MLWAWEKNPFLTTLLLAQQSFRLPSSEFLVDASNNSSVSRSPKGHSEEVNKSISTKETKRAGELHNASATTSITTLTSEVNDSGGEELFSSKNADCNYAKGRWVADSRRPFYSGFGCKRWLSGMWACRLTQRIDFSFEGYRWEPKNCKVSEFERCAFLRRMQDKTIAFIGDSLGRQQFQSMMCMASGGEESPEVEDVAREYGLVKPRGAKRPDGWVYRFPNTNTTILYYWSASLSDLEPINSTDPVSRVPLGTPLGPRQVSTRTQPYCPLWNPLALTVFFRLPQGSNPGTLKYLSPTLLVPIVLADQLATPLGPLGVALLPSGIVLSGSLWPSRIFRASAPFRVPQGSNPGTIKYLSPTLVVPIVLARIIGTMSVGLRYLRVPGFDPWGTRKGAEALKNREASGPKRTVPEGRSQPGLNRTVRFGTPLGPHGFLSPPPGVEPRHSQVPELYALGTNCSNNWYQVRRAQVLESAWVRPLGEAKENREGPEGFQSGQYGHHWNRGKLTANRWVMHVNGKPNENKELEDIRNAKNFTVHNVVRWLDSQLPSHPRLKAFFRTISPRHFHNGDWNTGGTCNNTAPLTGGSEVLQDESNDKVVESGVRGTKVKILDITAISELRDEAHISGYSIRPTQGINDCLHWCLPGVPDTWNELLIAQI
ncbi:hypothetical protein CRYUN_Cryun15aG0069100 [Craigia yunnanensis]